MMDLCLEGSSLFPFGDKVPDPNGRTFESVGFLFKSTSSTERSGATLRR